MLSMTDTPIEKFLPSFAETGVQVAFLVPTSTGYEKSIMDATAPVRDLLASKDVHNYDIQAQGPENKHIVTAYFVTPDDIVKTEASLYRPVTKHGDPRIWFSNLKKYCVPYNLLALITIAKEIYVINLSNPAIADSLLNNGTVYSLLLEESKKSIEIAAELLTKLREIHQEGFLPSITTGDPGVGDTLENALGISRNNLQVPDYKGIELKASRLTRGGKTKAVTRQTLFAKVPDEGQNYHELLNNFGKIQIPKNGDGTARFQLECTLKASKPNPNELMLSVDNNKALINILHKTETINKAVSWWYIKNLQETLANKHRETFWVKAVSEYQDGLEFFRYDKVIHTKNPNGSLLAPLIEEDIITVDLLAHIKPDGKYRDHGVLFKMLPQNLHLLFGQPKEYIL